MSPEELKQRFPNASSTFIRRNSTLRSMPDDNSAGICTFNEKPNERVSLDGAAQGEEACWYASARRFEILFIIYSRHPCDWDGYDIKALQDFLIKAGIIPDDGWQTLSGRVVSRKAATQAEEKTVIEIRPC